MPNVKFNGPDDQVNLDIQGEPLEHGKTYEVSASLAKALVADSAHFEKVTDKETDK